MLHNSPHGPLVQGSIPNNISDLIAFLKEEAEGGIFEDVLKYGEFGLDFLWAY